MIKSLLITASIILCTTFGTASQASGDGPIYIGIFGNKAIAGYDAVSYFQGDGVPVKGLNDFKTQWRSADWYFSSEENLNTFKSNPEAYAPQYGGYCTWAIAHGTLAKGDPETYLLENGKVYLNYDESIKKLWLPRRAELNPIADEKYPGLVDFNQE